jgi:deoxycytidine triphosphate deaminase
MEFDEKNFDEKNLMVDPLAKDPYFKENLGAVLLAEEIKEYSTKYGLLIASDFDKGKLKGASYTMSPDPDNAWRYDKNGKQVRVETKEDERGAFFNVEQHSLVYIRLLQKLRMPYYIIGRHNLKISYVYQGLLLGTGPQVDPGFSGNLYIPLHNLTNKDVKIYINESFVSIDFVRTSSHVFYKDVPCTVEDLQRTYPEKKHLVIKN